MTGMLEGHWVLDEDSGATAYDYSGNENHGSISGAGPQGTGTVTGPFGNSAYDFDGDDDTVDISNNFLTTYPFTISAWARHDTSGTFEQYYSEGDTSDLNNWATIRKTTADTVEFVISDSPSGTSTHVESNTTVTDGNWHLSTGVVDSDGNMEIYVDGISENTGTQPASPSSLNTADIGALEQTSGEGALMDGGISNVRVYNRILSPQEVQYLYQAGRRAEAVFDREVTK